MESLWSPPDQSGWLKKRVNSKSVWNDRFFALKGSFLFYFKKRKSSAKLHGVIPLENAKVETELPERHHTTAAPKHMITITLHVTHTYICKHTFYVLQAPNAEVQSAWVSALWQAAIPRADLLAHLHDRLPILVSNYAAHMQQCFPTADASVLSTSGRARIPSNVGNLGILASLLRKSKTVAARPQHSSATPHPQNKGESKLARTASGLFISAAAAQFPPNKNGLHHHKNENVTTTDEDDYEEENSEEERSNSDESSSSSEVQQPVVANKRTTITTNNNNTSNKQQPVVIKQQPATGGVVVVTAVKQQHNWKGGQETGTATTQDVPLRQRASIQQATAQAAAVVSAFRSTSHE